MLPAIYLGAKVLIGLGLAIWAYGCGRSGKEAPPVTKLGNQRDMVVDPGSQYEPYHVRIENVRNDAPKIDPKKLGLYIVSNASTYEISDERDPVLNQPLYTFNFFGENPPEGCPFLTLDPATDTDGKPIRENGKRVYRVFVKDPSYPGGITTKNPGDGEAIVRKKFDPSGREVFSGPATAYKPVLGAERPYYLVYVDIETVDGRKLYVDLSTNTLSVDYKGINSAVSGLIKADYTIDYAVANRNASVINEFMKSARRIASEANSQPILVDLSSFANEGMVRIKAINIVYFVETQGSIKTVQSTGYDISKYFCNTQAVIKEVK